MQDFKSTSFESVVLFRIKLEDEIGALLKFVKHYELKKTAVLESEECGLYQSSRTESDNKMLLRNHNSLALADIRRARR